MKGAIAAVLLLAASVHAVQAATVGATLAANGHKLFAAVIKCAGAEQAFVNSALKVTVLAPTDAAVLRFLRDMGLSADAALKNNALCDALVAYHVIPAQAASVAIRGVSFRVPTLAGRRNTLVFSKVGTRVTVSDAQSNRATVSRADIRAGDSIIHSVDRVLLSRYVFTSPAAALKFYSRSFSSLVGAVTRAGLLSTVTSKDFAGTVLAPSNRAFAKVPNAMGLPVATLRSVLTYHVLPTARAIPENFRAGRDYPTLLAGQSVRYGLTRRTTTINGKTRTLGTATFTSTSGNMANVVGPNVFAGKAIFHALDTVLMPGRRSPMAERGAATGRHLLQHGGGGARGGGGEGADAESMAIQAQMDDATDAIQWAATTGTPGATESAVDTSSTEAQAVGIVPLDRW